MLVNTPVFTAPFPLLFQKSFSENCSHPFGEINFCFAMRKDESGLSPGESDNLLKRKFSRRRAYRARVCVAYIFSADRASDEDRPTGNLNGICGAI